MAVSIFGHLDIEQRKLLETTIVHNDDRVNAQERKEFWTFICMPDHSAFKWNKNEWNIKGKEAFVGMEDINPSFFFLTDYPQCYRSMNSTGQHLTLHWTDW